jgi:hypothetical protein
MVKFVKILSSSVTKKLDANMQKGWLRKFTIKLKLWSPMLSNNPKTFTFAYPTSNAFGNIYNLQQKCCLDYNLSVFCKKENLFLHISNGLPFNDCSWSIGLMLLIYIHREKTNTKKLPWERSCNCNPCSYTRVDVSEDLGTKIRWKLEVATRIKWGMNDDNSWNLHLGQC